ncbi:hypothetical protein [uncultured Acetobacteroides sp.]|uniref:hypothetical protein n=1 Tax=uncultured Acetobacteroides sp. TaxID=1760811 RepID=UPI0029F4E078|nr:hypothetical protein [uncultured Acetobacteroides sp.]
MPSAAFSDVRIPAHGQAPHPPKTPSILGRRPFAPQLLPKEDAEIQNMEFGKRFKAEMRRHLMIYKPFSDEHHQKTYGFRSDIEGEYATLAGIYLEKRWKQP